MLHFDFESEDFFIGDRICVKVECRRDNENGLITYFRCLLPRVELYELLQVVRDYSKDNNVDVFLKELNEYVRKMDLKRLARRGTVMTKGAMTFIDKQEKEVQKSRIRARRGAFGFLPVYFTNDLVHGSW